MTGRSGSIGNVFFVEDDFWPLNTALYVKDFFGNDERFVFLLLQSLDLARFASGTGVPTLNRNHVSDEIVYVPESIDEQRRIVAVLDEAFAAIATATANAEKNLANARELFEAELAELFGTDRPGWTRRKLGAQVRVQSGFAFRSADYVDEGHFLVRIGNVQNGHLSLKNPKFVRLDIKTSKFELYAGDILTSLTGDIGRVATVQEEHLPAALNQRVARLIPNSNSGVSREFLLVFLRSDYFRLRLESRGHGAAQLNVSPKEIAEVEFVAPDETTQRAILSRLGIIEDAVSRLAVIYEKVQTNLSELQQALLHRAFTGELTKAKPKTIAV